jgi:hypothetical protein
MSTPGPQAHSYGGRHDVRKRGWVPQHPRSNLVYRGKCDGALCVHPILRSYHAFPPDKSENNIVYMHLPSSMFEPVLDLLRHENVLTVYWPWGAGQAFLFTGNLSIGAGAILPAINPATPDPTIHPAAPRSGNE